MNLPTLYVTVGLPRAGKTTWALRTGCPVVNPDSIRLESHGQKFWPPGEPLVWAYADLMVRSLFRVGHMGVVLDATNVTKKRRKQWVNMEWLTRYFVFPTTAELCIRRAHACGSHDLIPIIERMAIDYETLDESELHLTVTD